MNRQQSAVDVYDEVSGDSDRFSEIMMERGYSPTQCISLLQTIAAMRGAVDRPPTKRKIKIVIEFTLDDFEDADLTAELTEQILGSKMDNEARVIAVIE